MLNSMLHDIFILCGLHSAPFSALLLVVGCNVLVSVSVLRRSRGVFWMSLVSSR